jgi:hypothetical protein
MIPERRHHPRMKLNKLSCIQIEPDNNGVVLNFSENGLSFQAVAPIQVGRMRFWFLCPPNGRIEATGDLSWTDRTNRVGGLQFVDLDKNVRELVSGWLAESTVEPDTFRETDVADPILHKWRISAFERNLVRGFVTGMTVSLLAIGGIFVFKAYRRQISDLLVRSGQELRLKSEPQPFPLGSTPASPFSSPASDTSAVGQSNTGSASIMTADKPVHKTEQPNSETLDTSEQGKSELILAQQYLDRTNGKRNSEAAARLLWAAVSKGNTTAEVELAELYLTGDGVTKNCEQAHILLLAASTKGNASARQKLHGVLGYGCP